MPENKQKKIFIEKNYTDEVIAELDVIVCNIDERTHGPPMQIKR